MIKLKFKGKNLSKNQAKWLCENRFKECLEALHGYFKLENPKVKHWAGERGIMMLGDFAGEHLLTQNKGDFLEWEFSIGFESFGSVSDFLNID